MELTFNWTTAAMVSVPALLCWLAFALWQGNAQETTGHEERCDVCGAWHPAPLAQIDPSLNTGYALICDDCLRG